MVISGRQVNELRINIEIVFEEIPNAEKVMGVIIGEYPFGPCARQPNVRAGSAGISPDDVVEDVQQLHKAIHLERNAATTAARGVGCDCVVD